jgi:phenylacetate-CoA ligase
MEGAGPLGPHGCELRLMMHSSEGRVQYVWFWTLSCSYPFRVDNGLRSKSNFVQQLRLPRHMIDVRPRPSDFMGTISKRDVFANSLTSQLIKKAIYPLWTRRDHPSYHRYAKMFDKSQFLSTDELEEMQVDLLREQLVETYRGVPFYRRKMEGAGISPLDIRSIGDIRALPILTKRDIQENMDEMLSERIPASLRERNQTGGSTGSPLQFWVDKERFDSRRASTDRHNAWAHLYPGDWCAVLWGSRLDTGATNMPKVTWRQHFLDRSLILNTSLISEEDLANYIALLRRYRPQHLKAYAQSAVLFAKYCRERGADDICFKSIITTAEVLLPEQRALIEQVFRGRVFDRYGCREVSVIASECEHHTGLHVNSDALLIEIDPIPHASAGLGNILVTDLYNRSMPLIRYQIGDISKWQIGQVCPCGRSLPRLAGIEGRITDFLRLPDGKLISGPSLTLVVGDLSEIRQAQFVQRGSTEVQLRIVPGIGYGAHTAQELKRRLYPYFHDQFDLSIQMVENIPAEVSGKYRFVKAEHDNAFTAAL